MNAISFGTGVRKRPGVASEDANPEARSEAKSDKPCDAAWIVLEAANDLGDNATIEACRRVIDATLSGGVAAPSDLHVVSDYFR
jgi:hypothetical protein